MADDPVRAVLDRLEGVRKSGGRWTARCPAHDDRNPSLSISRGDKGVLLKCHSGCSFEDVLRALGLEPGDLFHDNGSGHPEIVGTYDYVDEAGELLFQAVRLFPKSFRQRRPDGRGGWIWRLGDVRRVLYRLPELVEAVALGKLVHVCEGEKDVHAVVEAGAAATTCPMGAGKWRDEYSEALQGARVRIVADVDEPGRDHARAVAASLAGVAESVEIVLPREGKDAADHLEAGHGLDDFLPFETTERKLAPPMSVRELLAVEDPEEAWLIEGLDPADANILLAAYPKSYKTMLTIEKAVALASATRYLGRFNVPERRRVGLVLMEDRDHRVRRRYERICWGRGIDPRDLEGWLYLWFRPPLRLNDTTVFELADYAGELELDFLAVDNWSYVATGDSNDSDEVTPQLQAFSGIRTKAPGISLQLTHHARKDLGEGKDQRLTDIIRNSSAFGAWYDAGAVLARKDEQSPVTVRSELRDEVAPDPFAFTVEDEDPAGPHNGHRSGGWLRLRVSDHRPEVLDRMAAAEKLVPAVRNYLEMHPGCSKRALREGVTGQAGDIDAARDLLVARGEVEIQDPDGPGKAAQISLLEGLG